jgi:hypothetical protein
MRRDCGMAVQASHGIPTSAVAIRPEPWVDVPKARLQGARPAWGRGGGRLGRRIARDGSPALADRLRDSGVLSEQVVERHRLTLLAEPSRLWRDASQGGRPASKHHAR